MYSDWRLAMYEFSFPEIAKYSASEIYDNILYLEETLNNEPQNQSIIQYIKSGVNVTINLNAISSDEINLNDIQRLINNSEQLQLPLNLYVSGGSSFGGSDESKIDMLFDEKTLKHLSTLDDFLQSKNQQPLRFLEDSSHPENAWTFEEVKKANASVDMVVNSIKKNNLSPYEAAAFIHRVVTGTFKYNDDFETPINARSLIGIMSTDKIVCVGYARFTKSVCDKLNMDGLECDTFISTLTSTGFESEIYAELNISPSGTCHMQNLFKIRDEKYKIKGVYASDSCWDSKTEYFPAGKGYSSFMFPVTDLTSYSGIIFTQPKDGLDALLQVCNVDTKSYASDDIPVIKDNMEKSKVIPMEKLKACLTNLYGKIYKNADNEEIDKRVERAIEVSKIVSRSIFNETATNAIAVESFRELYTTELDFDDSIEPNEPTNG